MRLSKEDSKETYTISIKISFSPDNIFTVIIIIYTVNMVYSRKYTKKRRNTTFKRKRIVKKYRKKLVRRKAYNQNFELKAEIRVDMRGAGFTNGSDGVRAAIYWGRPLLGTEENFVNQEHILSPFSTYEWNAWKNRFQEFQIVGVKIKA